MVRQLAFEKDRVRSHAIRIEGIRASRPVITDLRSGGDARAPRFSTSDRHANQTEANDQHRPA